MKDLAAGNPDALRYTELPFLTDRDALPHPFQGGDADAVLLIWFALVLLGGVLAFLASRWVDSQAILEPGEPTRVGHGQWRRWPAALVLICAASARLLTLGLQPADSQEVTYLLQAIYPLEHVEGTWIGLWLTWLSPQMVSPHPPLYRTVLYLWANFGESLYWLRLPAALAGIASVWVFMTWMSRFVTARWVWAAGLALALNPLHVYYSQSISPYTLATLLVLVAYSMHDDAVERGRRLTVYGLVTGAAMITHFIAVAALAPLGLLLLRDWVSDSSYAARAKLTRYVSAAVLAVTLVVFGLVGFAFYAQMVPFIFPVIDAMKLFPPDEEASLVAYWGGFLQFALHGMKSTLASPYGGIGGVVALGLVSLSTAGAWARMRSRRSIRAAMWVFPVAILFFFSVGAITVAQNKFHYFASRRFVPLVPFVLGFVVVGAQTVWSTTAVKRRSLGWVFKGSLVALIMVGSALQLTVLMPMWQAPVKPDMNTVVAALDSRLEDGDAIAVGPYGFFDFMYNFHARERLPEWFHAGGPARWVPYGGDTDRLVMLAPGDISLPWAQALRHRGLRRVWLVEVDEAPLGLRELLGGGNIRAEALLNAGAIPCESDPGLSIIGVTLQCFRAPGVDGAVDGAVLDIGSGDYREIAGFSPPGQVRSRRRRLTEHSRIWLEKAATHDAIELTFDTRLERPDVRVLVTGQFGARRHVAMLELSPGVERYRVPIGGLGREPGWLTVDLSPQISASESDARCLRFRRERFKPGRPDCGVFLKRARVVKAVGGYGSR